MRFLLIASVLLIGISLPKNVKAFKINYPRVLLPIFDKLSVNFTLEVVGGPQVGCFRWESSQSSIISLRPIYDDVNDRCASKAIVTVVTRDKHRSNVMVFAEDITSGESIRCDVMVDVIDQLEVLTTSRELLLGEAPETFELYAQDSQGNAFTTLTGIEFNWEITTRNSQHENWQQVLRFLRFSESEYHEVPQSVERFDGLGLTGYMVLLEGLNTGAAKVTAKLPYTEYAHVPAIEVNIMVLANIVLYPQEANILVGDTIQYQLKQLKQGRFQEITLNSQYYLEVEHNEYAKLKKNIATGVKLGKTVVMLRDRNFDTDTMRALLPKATLNVVDAARLNIALLPHNNWITVEGATHDIAFDLYTRDEQPITLGPAYRISSTVSHEIFQEISRTRNGSQVYGTALNEGRTPVSGNYDRLSAEAELIVYKNLILSPSLVILPFDAKFSTRHQIQFKALGGDGAYIWSSLNTNLVTITPNGLADATLKKQEANDAIGTDGKMAHIQVAMSRNLMINRKATILFLPPIKLEIIRYSFETPLKDIVQVHVALYTQHNDEIVPITVCDNLNFDLEFSNQIFMYDDHEKSAEGDLEPNACRIFHLRAIHLGTTSLKIAYKFDGKVLKDEVNMVVFEKLSIINPISNEIVLPIGSSRNVIYKHGPLKMFTEDSELTKNVIYNKDLVDVTDHNIDLMQGKHIFRILCKKLGINKFRFEIFNKIMTKNNVPYISVFETDVHCVKPRYLQIVTSQKIKEGCPLNRDNSLMHVKNLENKVEVEIEVLDELRRPLSNISSLEVDWLFYQGEKLEVATLAYSQDNEVDIVEGVEVPKRDFLTATLSNVDNNFKITGNVKNYNAAILRSYGIKAESPHFWIQKTPSSSRVTPKIENELIFYAADRTMLPFDSISVFLSTKNIERIKISSGSGYYDFDYTESGIASVEFDSKNSELLIKPIRIGDVRVSILDRCLMTEAAHLFISIVSIGRIEITMTDRVEKTKSIEAIAMLRDSNGRSMNIDYANLAIYELDIDIFNTNLVSVELGPMSNLQVGEVRYIVTGIELGETKIVVTSGKTERKISSSAAPIQVFPPLRLYPRNVTLVIGSSIQIYSTGGPSPDVNIVYSALNSDIVSIDSSVVTGSALGETIVTGRCVATHPSSGAQISFSEDTVAIRVIPLDRIKIKVPLYRFKVGATIPASIWGVPDLNPMILGTLDALKIQWTTHQSDIVEIHGIFADAGIQYGDEDAISVRIKALNPGKAIIQATVTTSTGAKFKSSVEITVFKMLELESPKRIVSDTILIPPKSKIHLKSNVEDTTYELETSDTQHNIAVTRSGIITTTETNGRSLIIASSADQTLPIPIEVKNIHYILASLHPQSLKLNSVERKIPVGFQLLLRVTLHDNLGNEFSHNFHDLNPIQHKLSRKGIVEVATGDNFTLTLNLVRDTPNMLSISLKDPVGIKYSEDIIKLAVGPSEYVYPMKNFQTVFTVGDIICFDSHIDSSSKWHSSDSTVLTIDEDSGVGQVLSSRSKQGNKVTVYQGEPSTGSLKFDLDVKDADKVEFTKTNDVMNTEVYRAPLLIKNYQQTDKTINVFSKNQTGCFSKLRFIATNLFTCRVTSRTASDVLQYIKAKPVFDLDRGSYACDVNLLIRIDELQTKAVQLDLSFELEARLSNGVSTVMLLKLVPQILITPRSVAVDQIDSQSITIKGLDRVLSKMDVKSTDTTIVEVTPASKTANERSYKLKLLDEFPDDREIGIRVYSPITQQEILIPIQLPMSSLKCSTSPFYNSTANDFINWITKFGLLISLVIVSGATIGAIIVFFNRSTPADNKIFLSPQQNGNAACRPNETQFIRSPGASMDSNFSSPYMNNSGGGNTSRNSDSIVYGDTTMLSPQRRLNRRFI